MGLPMLMASSLRQFCRHIQKYIFQWEVHMIAFDEAHFIVNLHSFLQPLALPYHTFPPSESFVPHSPMQDSFQNSSPPDTSKTALVCIFSAILNHS